jgi:hypothetical protein
MNVHINVSYFLKTQIAKEKGKKKCKSISRMEFINPKGKTLNLSPQIEYSYVIELSKGSCLLDSWLIMSKKIHHIPMNQWILAMV